MEEGWEASLPAFPRRAIALGDASIQRDLHKKMQKLSLHAQRKEQARDDAMDVDSTNSAPAPAPTSATIASIVDKRVNEAFKRIEGLIARGPAKKGSKVESKSSSSKRKLAIADISSPPRKKARQGADRPPQAQSSERERERERQQAEVWEEVREFQRQERNLIISGNPIRVPDMYLDISEQAQKHIALSSLRENELLGVAKATIFISKDAYLPSHIEHFLSLNGKFVLAEKRPLDDTTLLLQWAEVERQALWAYFFRNEKKSTYDPRMYIRSDALIPESIPSVIQEGLDAGARELLSQAASSRLRKAYGVNPRVAPVKEWLLTHQLIVKPTDKNLGLAAFTAKEYIAAVINHIDNGPYECVHEPFDSAITFASSLVERLPRKGLSKEELKYIRAPRDIEWPQFHMIPKVHKAPWGWRPIVPAHSSPTARMSKVADIALAKLLPRFPHLIRSTAEWCRAFHAGFERRHGGRRLYLVTGDIVAYYTNIDTATIGRSMEALLRGSKVPAARASALAHLVDTVTSQNYFQIEDKFFRQTNGLAMGSPCSGTVANLSLARREKRVIHRDGILVYTRYIDDVFMLVEARNDAEVRLIVQEVSDAAKPLRINWAISRTHAVYLDVQVELDGRGPGTMSYRPFRKPGNQLAYLPWSSAHPVHVKKGLVIGETTRLSLLCSEEHLFKTEVAAFRDNLCRRGYPVAAVNGWTRRVRWSDRFGKIFLRSKEDSSTDRVLRIPTTYNPVWEGINLRQVFDKVLDEWRWVWDADSRPSHLSLSQRRGENIMDLLSSWNKSVLGSDDMDTDTEGLEPEP